MIEETIQEIQRAVEKAAGKGSRAEQLLAVMAIEGWREHVVWQGKVVTSRLKGHSKAKRAYGCQTGEGKDAKFTAALEIPPLDSANTAVRAAIAGGQKPLISWER